MPRYFFDTDDGTNFVRDEDGIDFQDVAAARREGLRALTEIIHYRPIDTIPSKVTICIRDGTGRKIVQLEITVESRDLAKA